jgi:PAS domain-containing protein
MVKLPIATLSFSNNQDRGSWSDEVKAIHRDGTLFDVQVSASAVLNRNGKPIALTSTSIDVTYRKRAEEALRESEQQYRNFVENANEAIFEFR